MVAAAAPRPMRLPNDDATNGWSAILPPRTPRPALQGDVAADWLRGVEIKKEIEAR